MSEKDLTIGVDIGGSHIHCAAINTQSGTLLEDTRVYTKVNNKLSKEEIFNQWAAPLNQILDKLAVDRVKGIGFAMPGAFNYREGVALYEGNDKYEALYGTNVKDTFPAYLDRPETPIRFLNDASAFAVGENWFGEAKGTRRSIAITLGTGFGSALIEDGIPIVNRADVPEQGCFWHLPHKDGMADDYFSTRWFVNTFHSKTGQELKGVKEIADLARQEVGAKAIFDLFGTNLGEFMAPWLKKFPAEVIVIGGNIAKAFDLFSDALQQVLANHELTTSITVSRLMEDASLFGSARLFEDTFWAAVKDNLPTI
ncbi:MAG: ROK family protein [Saprospiraceae bacterium]|nr:ROK family protein [Saprospiraceae bacterium]